MATHPQPELPEEQDDRIELIDEEGNTVTLDHLATLEYEGESFLVLSDPENEQDDDSEEIIIMKIEQDNQGNDIYVQPDEETENAVFEYFLSMLDEMEEDSDS